MTPVTCLFCQHINPAGASFCNSCAAQLNLKPCPHCDAVDDIMATHCYKCGAPFPLREMAEPVAIDTPGALDTAQTAPFLENATSTPAQEALRREDAALAPAALERPHDATASDLVRADARYRPGWLMPLTALLLLLLVVSAYMYLRQPEKKPLPPSAKPQVQLAPAAPTLPAASAESPRVSVTASPRASNSTPIHSPPATAPEAVTRRFPSLENDCAPAVAVLGLCNPETGQGKP